MTMNLDFAVRAPRMVLVNMVTGDARTPQFNPSEFEEKLGATYADLQVPGLSHKVQHFINTENVKYSFDLMYHCLDGSGPDGLAAILEDRKFLYALVHPWRADGIKRGGAPRVLFIWPKLISLTCVVKSLSFKYTMFNLEGSPIAYNAKVELEEIRDVFVGMDDILAQGTQRSPAGAVTDLGDI
jgi:hypothetical protein